MTLSSSQQAKYGITPVSEDEYCHFFLKTMFDAISSHDSPCFYYANPHGSARYTYDHRVGVSRSVVDHSAYMTSITNFEQLWQCYEQTGVKTFSHTYKIPILSTFLEKVFLQADLKNTYAFLMHHEPDITMELKEWVSLSTLFHGKSRPVELLLDTSIIEIDRFNEKNSHAHKSTKGCSLNKQEINTMLYIYQNHWQQLSEFLYELPLSTQTSAEINRQIIKNIPAHFWENFTRLPGMKAEVANHNNDSFFETLSQQFVLSFDIYRLVSHMNKKAFEYHHAIEFTESFVSCLNKDFANNKDYLDYITCSFIKPESDMTTRPMEYLNEKKNNSSYVNLLVSIPEKSWITRKDIQVFFLESLEYTKNSLPDSNNYSQKYFTEILESFLPEYVKTYSLFKKIENNLNKISQNHAEKEPGSSGLKI
jgi:hypothetical protein